GSVQGGEEAGRANPAGQDTRDSGSRAQSLFRTWGTARLRQPWHTNNAATNQRCHGCLSRACPCWNRLSVASRLVAGQRGRLRRFTVDRPAAKDDGSLLDMDRLQLEGRVARVVLEAEQGDRVARQRIAVPADLDVVLLGDL